MLNTRFDRRIIAHRKVAGLPHAIDVPKVDVAHLALDVDLAQPALIAFDDPEKTIDLLRSLTPISYSARSDWSGVRSQT